MNEQNTNITNAAQNKGKVETADVKKELTYDDKVLQKIIGIALEHVDGLLTVDGGFFSNIAEKLVNTDNAATGVNVEVGKKQVAVDLDVVVEYGRNIPKLFDEIVKVIEQSVKEMTGLELVEANVNVVDVKSQEEYDEESVTVQDRLTDTVDKAGDAISDGTAKIRKGAKKTGDNVKETIEDSKRVE